MTEAAMNVEVPDLHASTASEDAITHMLSQSG